MPNKMLIDATHPEETRVVVVRGNRVEEFDFETAQRKQLRGNIYLAKVTRVEPSLQAAFVEYGGNRHGFLAFSEIHPDYYQIPIADRQALIEADERAHREAEEEDEHRHHGRRRSRHRNSRRRDRGERVQSWRRRARRCRGGSSRSITTILTRARLTPRPRITIMTVTSTAMSTTTRTNTVTRRTTPNTRIMKVDHDHDHDDAGHAHDAAPRLRPMIITPRRRSPPLSRPRLRPR